MESLKWTGDERLPQFYKIWKVITTGMAIPLDDRILCDIFLERIRPSKKLASDIHEFDCARACSVQEHYRPSVYNLVLL